MPTPTSKPKPEESNLWENLGLIGALGLEIALPLVGLTLLGRWLDVRYDASPFFLLTGVGVSIVLTSIFIALKIRKLLK